MSDEAEKLVLQMFLELIPKDVPKDYVPYSEDMPLADCFPNFNEPLLDQIPPPIDSQRFGEIVSSKLNEDPKHVFAGNIEMLPKLPDVCPMEIDLTVSDIDDEVFLPMNDKSDVLLDEPDPCTQITNLIDLEANKKVLQVKCLHSEENLRRKCEVEGLKFNGYQEYGEVIDNCDPCEEMPSDGLKQVQVECLSSLEALKQMCESEKLKFNYSLVSDSADAYEVDMIFAHKVIGDEIYYYIKWKNYSSESNTWEPLNHLTTCLDTIKYYHAMKGSKIKVDSKLLAYFIKDLISRKPYDILTLIKVCALIDGKSERDIKKLKLKISEMKFKAKEILSFLPKKLRSLQNKLFQIMQFGEARKRVLINLIEWQQEINSNNTAAYIEVENNVDLETAPSGFEFIHDYINTVMTTPEEPVAFCNCENCYDEKKTCCPCDSEGHFAYNRYQRLILKPGYPIFECNRKCCCDSNCINRVVQNGQKVKVRIFRTSNGCGWGLKTLENIEKGQFVLEYLGEIITSEAAEARGNIYDYVGRSYLFDLDYGIDNSVCCFTVDAGHCGNASHFINHSCNPNLHVFAVWINQPDPSLPRLAFFAKRKIFRGEELTFDYKMVQKDRFGSQRLVAEESERILCKCKSKNCRKYLF